MAKNILSFIVLFSALTLILVSGCTDSTGYTNITPTSTVNETITSAITPDITNNVNTTTNMTDVAEEGDIVSVQYTGTFNNGTVFDESEPDDPLMFTLGEHLTIPGFEDAIYGMKIGETKNIHLTPDQAYGEYNPQLVFNISRDKVAEDVELYEGAQLVLSGTQGDFQVTVLSITNETVELDANYQMAGKELNFEITLVDIEKSE